MTAEYSAHPALAPAQLQRAEATQSHHRRHHHGATSGKSGGGGGGVGGGGGGGVAGGGSSSHQATTSPASTSSKSAATATALSLTTDAPPTLPDRTAAAAAAVLKEEDEDDDVCCDDDNNDDDDVSVSAGEVASVDETDHVQHRFSRTATASAALSTSLSSRHQQHTSSNNNNNNTTTTSSSSNNNKTSFHCSRQQAHLRHQPPTATSPPCAGVGRCVDDDDDDDDDGDGDGSGLSSAGCSPSASTTSSPLSTPTRLVVPPCCQKTAAGAAAAAATASSTSTTMSAAATEQQHPHNTHPHLHHHNHNHQHQQQPHHQHQHQHQHHHHHHHHHSVAGCKKLQKFDPRLGPSPYRQLLPIALCILSFATVFSILIVYMDTTEIRHQQFRLNMSRDYELNGVAQDDPTLIAFLREIHMKKYPMHFLKNRDVPTLDQQQQQQYPHLNFSGHHELTPEMAHYVADLVGRKQNGAVIQSLPGAMGQMLTAPWLAGTLNWAGVIVEPEPRRYFALRKQNAHHPKMQVVHACVSPNEHPKEVTIHNEDAEVRINSLLDEETSWFNSRVKCFPLYTIMLACNRVEYDLLSLGVHGHELEILQTLPFDRIQIEVISIHFPEDHDNVRGYIQSVTKFLKGKSYKLQRKFGRNYFYQKINSTNRTRKKDILLMKQP